MTGGARPIRRQPPDPPPQRPPINPVSGRKCRSALSALLPGLDTFAPERRPILAVHVQSSADLNRQNIPQAISARNVRSEPAYQRSVF